MATERMAGGGGAKRAARRAQREAAPWIEKAARAGYAAKGAVYVLVGGIALAAALGAGHTTGSTGALASIGDSTPGRVVLAVIAVGLFGYALWGVLRMFVDPEHDDAAHRVAYGVTGIIYGLLGWEAARIALDGGGASGSGGAGGGEGADHWSATLMQQPFGQLLVGASGLVVGLYGLHQIWNAWRVDLDDHLALGSMSRTARTWTVRFGRFGLAARGVVLTIIGGFFVVAAVQADPSEARGLGGVLAMMQEHRWLLAVLALGLIAYGLYNFVRAKYRVIRAGSR